MRFFFCVAVLFVVGCGSREVDREELVERKGVTYQVNSDLPFTGVAVEYDKSNGKKKYECRYKDGKKNGVEIAYWKNGQKSSQYNYNLGKKDGVQLTWHDNGQKRDEWHYKDGLCSREPKAWDSEGNSSFVLVMFGLENIDDDRQRS